jgi:LmbE family N-acetylglucosaminyl deacetylase
VALRVPHVYVPDGTPIDAALARTTYLAIVAHPDDLELLALPWIAECRDRPNRWFTGIICADGARSPRRGRFATTSDDEMARVRVNEQRRAAELGRYGALVPLSLPSEQVQQQVDDLAGLLDEYVRDADAGTVITHDPFDRHGTHAAVTRAVVAALKALPARERPRRLLGVEGWRSLDWVPRESLVAVDCTGAGPLGRELLKCFESQIEGGKPYDRAAEGRRRANAVFADPFTLDDRAEVVLAVDLTPLLADDGPTLDEFAAGLLERFGREVRSGLATGPTELIRSPD